ncbi:MAG: toprim domain-containing protein, partial [Bdellovibrionales bacterium]|nr:toprim domain-containing protein [Bdellovibrionales bacterium]
MSKAEKRLVIVESPTKARTIKKFLGKEFVVESCMGHVRDLPQSAKDIPEKFKKLPWANLGVNVEDGFEPIYCIPKTKTRIVKNLKDKLKEVDELILATDEDREGESISWHLLEVLGPKVPVKRMVFHEITKDAIRNALDHFREVDENLVKAQEARRILDRLVGYTISPLLWKKVAYGLSAGRVQSVAVRLIAEKEHERLRFKKSQYWNLTAQNEKDKVEFESRLLSISDKRVATGRDFDGTTGDLLKDRKDQVVHLLEKEAKDLLARLKGTPWKVSEVEEKPLSRKPAPPFITSTLQQEAN